MKEFTLQDHCFTSVNVTRTWSKYAGRTDLTQAEMLEVLQGKGTYVSQSSEDHPAFAELRNQLEAEGFIKCQRQWWNGDTVLKPFRLNGKPFRTGDRFLSASPIKYDIDRHNKEVQRRLKWRSSKASNAPDCKPGQVG